MSTQKTGIVYSNLYGSIYQLGQCLLQSEQSLSIEQTIAQLQQSLDEVITQSPYSLLQEYLYLSPLCQRILCLNVALAREPDLLHDFARLAAYEQGPLLSLERSLLFCQNPGDDKDDSLHEYLKSALNQWQLLAPESNQCSGRLMQSLILADGLWSFLHAPTIINACSFHRLQSHVLSARQKSKVGSGLYDNQIQGNLPRVLFIEGLNAKEHLAYVKALCSKDNKETKADRADRAGGAGKEKSASIHLYEVGEGLGSGSGEGSAKLSTNNSVEPGMTHEQNIPIESLKQSLVCAYLHARVQQQNFYCYWPDFTQQLHQQPALKGLLTILSQLPQSHIILTGSEEVSLPELNHKRRLRPPHAKERLASWGMLLDIDSGKPSLDISKKELALIATLYPLSGDQMQSIVDQLLGDKDNSVAGKSVSDQPTVYRIQQACLDQLNTRDESLAKYCKPRFSFSDMQLADETRAQLQGLVTRLQYAEEMQDILPNYRPGIQALLYGKPGTGKSMAAEALANELQLPLYKVNLANVASKWIGESEKQLASLFDQAEAQNAVLLFDEADAIFSKRSEVESSHDKNANMGVSYLLQRMESYTALLLLSTNFKSNIDNAFLRRFDAVIEFSLPDKIQRYQHWQRLSTSGPSFESRIDIVGLSEIFELSIAQIDNVYEHALLSALERGGDLQKTYLIEALGRELAKDKARLLCQQDLQRWG